MINQKKDILPKVSITIAVKEYNSYLDECVRNCLQLEYPNFEILVLPDNSCGLPYAEIKIIPTGPVGPSHKRDIALEHSEGDILAYLDDDTFPRKDWLKNAVKHFEKDEVAAVGGPAVTPSQDSFMQKASGYVYSSFVGGGSLNYRYVPGKSREVDDYPTCNLLVRKAVMEELEGFDTNFWPGEDTKLCLQITKDLGKKIIYDPGALVYHHRRKLFLPHLKQVWSYALHRGYFVKKFPETSMRLTYFIPTFFVFGLVVGSLLSFLSPALRPLFLVVLAGYFLTLFLDSFRSKSLIMTLAVTWGTFLTHVTYGVGFVKGLFAGRLREE